MSTDSTTPATSERGLRMRRIANDLTPEQVVAPLEHGEIVRITVHLDGNRTVQVWGRPTVATTTVGNAILDLEITSDGAKVYDGALREVMMDIADRAVRHRSGPARRVLYHVLTRLAQMQPLDGTMPEGSAPDPDADTAPVALVSVPGGHTLATYTDRARAERHADMINDGCAADRVVVEAAPPRDPDDSAIQAMIDAAEGK